MSARALAWAWRQQPATTSQKLVLAALADRADDDGECFPSVSWLAEKCAPMPEESVRRILRELAKQGLVEKAERRRRVDGTLSTWIYRLPVDDEAPPGTSDQWSPPGTSARTDLDLPDGEVEPDGSKVESAIGDNFLLTRIWMTHAPPLIQHRESFLAERGTQRALTNACKRYPSEVIGEAIANYAAVLGGDEFFWSHRWTLIEFLKRGLDKFVPEARPLENFRTATSNGTKFGRRDVSSRELLDLADRLEAERETN